MPPAVADRYQEQQRLAAGGQQAAPARTGVDTLSAGRSLPGTSAGSRWRAAGSGPQVSRWPGGLIPWPEAGTGATARQVAPARDQIPPMVGVHHQEGQRSEAGGQRDSGRPVPGTRATARQAAPARYRMPPALADRHQVQQRSAAGRQPEANNGTGPQALNRGGALLLTDRADKNPSVSFVSSVSGGTPETGGAAAGQTITGYRAVQQLADNREPGEARR